MREAKQRKETLEWLQTKGELTFRDAVFYLNIMDVRKRIQELRERGYNIETTYRYPASGSRYGVYKLIEEAAQ